MSDYIQGLRASREVLFCGVKTLDVTVNCNNTRNCGSVNLWLCHQQQEKLPLMCGRNAFKPCTCEHSVARKRAHVCVHTCMITQHGICRCEAWRQSQTRHQGRGLVSESKTGVCLDVSGARLCIPLLSKTRTCSCERMSVYRRFAALVKCADHPSSRLRWCRLPTFRHANSWGLVAQHI